MTFEKALEAMKQGKKVRRKSWIQNVCIGIYNTNIIENMIYDSEHGFYTCCTPTEFVSHDLFADDWEIHEPKTWNNCRCEFNPEPWLLKSNQHTEDLAKQVRKAFESYTIEPSKEERTMHTDLEITFKSGETITYKEGEWDDYSYDGKSVIVKYKGAWIGIYNFDNVFCVELKQ